MNHYFTDNTDLKHNICEKKVSINGHDFVFFTDNGVFSKNGLDFGTRSLLESLPDYIHGDVLDFGCGYGPIGIYLKKIFNCNVDMIDINNRSIELAIKNALQNNVNVNVFNSNIYENVTKKYDTVITNPPIRVGKDKLLEILFGACEHLKENGTLYFVIRKDQGALSIKKILEESKKVELLEKDKGFFIYSVKNI